MSTKRNMKDKCHRCNSTNVGNSPTGWWCNNCGLEDPCPCWRGNHDECIERQNKVRLKNNLPAIKSCCCGKQKIQREVKMNWRKLTQEDFLKEIEDWERIVLMSNKTILVRVSENKSTTKTLKVLRQLRKLVKKYIS